jgi:hypothetical protein
MKVVITKSLLLYLLLFTLNGTYSQKLPDFFEKSNQFFKANVFNEKIDYQKIKNAPDDLNNLINLAASLQVNVNDSNTYRAFWINVYNLTVIHSVIANYPVNSPLSIPGFFDKETHLVSGKNITLNDIENKLLRGQFNFDPKFHFVLVCGGVGCPPIINKAYMPDSIEEQLEKQTLLSINNPEFIKINHKKKRVQFSQIFEWYKSDFESGNKSLIDFINLYMKEPISSKYKSSYYPYDWSLNDTK